MKRWLPFILWLLIAPCVSSQTLGDLLVDLRYRTGEHIISESSFADSVAIGWINMAQSRVVKLGGYLPKYVNYVYEGDTDYVALPDDFRAITQLKVLSEGQWYDDSTIQGDVDWADEDSAELVLAIDAFAERLYDFTYVADSNEYSLPSDFRQVKAVLVQRDGEWWGAIPNLGLVYDTGVLNYTVHQHDIDSTSLFIRGAIPSIELLYDFTYVADSNEYLLPSDFRQVKAVLVRRDGEWLGVTPNPGLVYDTSLSQYTVHQYAVDSSILYVGGIIPSIEHVYDVLYDETITHYQLPDGFRQVTAVLIHSNDEWSGALPNQGLVNDTDVFNYMIYQHGVDSADIYIKGPDLIESDTIRVFYASGLRADDLIRVIYGGGLLPADTVRVVYQGALRSGDTLRVEYLAAATSMGTDTTSVCQVPTDLQTFIVEEAIGYYYGYLRMFQQQALIWQSVRVDMGILKQEGK